MHPSTKVMWKVGTFLTPQHIQQMERYLEGLIQLSARGGSQVGWGLISASFNAASLAQRKLKLESCQAILPPPDSGFIDIPAMDGELEIPFELPRGNDAVEVFLTLPAAPSADRYAEGERKVVDLYSPAVRQIKVADKSLRLSLNRESAPSLSVLKIAEIERDRIDKTKPVLSTSFIPTCAVLSAAPVLLHLNRTLTSRLDGWARELPKLRQQRRSEEFLFHHTLSQQRFVLQHLGDDTADLSHPAELYRELLRLAAGLASFHPNPPAVPRYNHRDLTRCCTELYRQIDILLNSFAPPATDSVIVLAPDQEGPENMMWSGNIAGNQPSPGASILLAIRGEVPIGKLLANLKNSGKIAASSSIWDIVANSASGVGLRHETDLPDRLRLQAGVYFRLETRGALWDAICKSGEISVYIPGNLLDGKTPTLEIIHVQGTAP